MSTTEYDPEVQRQVEMARGREIQSNYIRGKDMTPERRERLNTLLRWNMQLRVILPNTVALGNVGIDDVLRIPQEVWVETGVDRFYENGDVFPTEKLMARVGLALKAQGRV